MNDLTDDLLDILEDPRPIKALVGDHGITKIVPYAENGEMAPVTWFAVYCDEIVNRVNGRYVAEVFYETGGCR